MQGGQVTIGADERDDGRALLVRSLDELECGFLLPDGKMSGPETVQRDVLSLGKLGELIQESSGSLQVPILASAQARSARMMGTRPAIACALWRAATASSWRDSLESEWASMTWVV